MKPTAATTTPTELALTSGCTNNSSQSGEQPQHHGRLAGAAHHRLRDDQREQRSRLPATSRRSRRFTQRS